MREMVAKEFARSVTVIGNVQTRAPSLKDSGV
jgi:hypothetical protein